jgi:hypothetical protein
LATITKYKLDFELSASLGATYVGESLSMRAAFPPNGIFVAAPAAPAVK